MSYTPARFDFDDRVSEFCPEPCPCPQGATFEPTFTLREPDNDDGSPGETIPVDGKKFRMKVRPSVDSDEVKISASWGAGASAASFSYVTDGTDGEFKLTIPSNVTAALDIDHKRTVWWYDLEMYDDSVNPERVDRLYFGKFVVTPEVTR